MPEYTVSFDHDLLVTHDVEHDHTVIRTKQLNHREVMERIQRKRIEGQQQGLELGKMVASFPVNDLPEIRRKYPEIFHPEADSETKRKALIRLSNDPEMDQYRIARA